MPEELVFMTAFLAIFHFLSFKLLGSFVFFCCLFEYFVSSFGAFHFRNTKFGRTFNNFFST